MIAATIRYFYNNIWINSKTTDTNMNTNININTKKKI